MRGIFRLRVITDPHPGRDLLRPVLPPDERSPRHRGALRVAGGW
ncbi:MAG TPA: hypothetical protein VI248_14285 [Kineosporiaceae bacterium]